MIGKNLRKIMYQLILMFCMLKKKKICSAYVLKNNVKTENKTEKDDGTMLL